MIATDELPDCNTLITCPETGRPTKVWVEAGPTGIWLRGCSRYWGGLLCDGACEAEALAEFLADAQAAPCVYCGRPNEASPRPRED